MEHHKEIVIVTGSCGRIGAHVVRRLGTKYRIIGFELLKAIYATGDEELVPVDLSSDESVSQAFTHIKQVYGNKIAAVVHLAAYYSFDHKYSPLYDKITVEGTRRLLKELKAFEVEQFIFSSTMLVHAPCEPDQRINEEWPLMTTWGYPLSKVQTEQLIHKFRGDMRTVIMRIAGVYDDECHSIPISNQIQRIYEKQMESHLFSGDISHGAAFLHMEDLVSAIELAVDKRSKLPEELTLLIGENKTLSYDQLQRNISKLLFNEEIRTFSIPKPFAKLGSWVQCHTPWMPRPFVKPWMIDLADDNYTLDISRAKKFLGWEPKHSLPETLPLMIKDLKRDPDGWYRKNLLKT